MRKILLILGLTLFIGIGFGESLHAQCPMCKISMESNLNSGGTAGQGLNKGILYLFATPYLIIGGIAFFWYRNRKEDAENELAELN